MKLALFVGLGIITVLYLAVLARAVIGARRARPDGGPRVSPTPFEVVLGFVTAFFDTLGIGSYAPTTAVLKLRRLVADEKIPGTLNVGHTLATVTQAFIFIAVVTVELKTLVLMIVAACLGSWLGAGMVAKASRRMIQIAMGLALLVAATLFLMKIFEVLPSSGDTQGLAGWKLGAGLAGNFLLGALMEVGVGLYGPCMILCSLLGMNPTTAFPIMMGSCAFLMPVGTFKFVKSGRYSLRTTLGLALGGVPAVLIAALIVKSLPLTAMRWLVVVVVLYAAVSMLRSAMREAKTAATTESATAPAPKAALAE
ncbi:MAG TPA: sulfite exporter TauE/SafE family protein [Thermoanaerobaculia bacterium]|nr:sulfite exporter TauE/SafE family protein [Thermoanaerobaculia bacterium]